jgi:hypothetical protein
VTRCILGGHPEAGVSRLLKRVASMSEENLTYFVRLVVVLWVELEYLGPLLVVKSANQLLDAHATVVSPPLLAVDKPAKQLVLHTTRHMCMCIHFLGELDIELSRTEESQLRLS